MKFVYFLEDSGYNHNICEALRKEDGALIPPGFRLPIQKKLFYLHNAWPLNRKVELPFKRVWFRNCLNESKLSQDDEIQFVFYESYHMTFSKQFLRYLKKKYKKAQFCFTFTNPADSYNLSKLNTVRKYFDHVSTFNRDDAAKYGFAYSDICLYDPTEIPDSDFPESDVFFVGADKGRLNTILPIYETLTEAGLRCDFFIVGVPEEKQKHPDKIKYNHPISYEEVLQRISKSKCVLEVLQGDCAYSSMRTAEAYVYRKKLLTTNWRVTEERYYTPQIIQVVTDPKKIDIAFFDAKVEESVYAERDFYSYHAMIKHAEAVYREKTKENAT